MNPEALNYMSYLLRLWRAGNAEEPSWRAALENPRTGERQVFGDLASLFAFLQEKTRSAPPDIHEPPPVTDRKTHDEG
jgi:hypothetical protein